MSVVMGSAVNSGLAFVLMWMLCVWILICPTRVSEVDCVRGMAVGPRDNHSVVWVELSGY